MFSEKFKIAIGFTAICLIWGSTWLVIRVGLNSLTPIIAVGLRFSTAALLVFLIIKSKGLKLQKDELSLKLYVFLGFFSFLIPFGLVYWAEQFIPSGLTSILFAILPFGVIIFSKLMMKDSIISPNQIVGVVLGFIGIIVIFSENLKMEFSGYILGISAALFGALIQAYVAVVIKKHGKHLNVMTMNFIPLLIAGILMTIAGIILEDKTTWVFDLKAVGSIIYLALFGTVIAFTVYYWLIKKMNLVILSLNSFISPIIAVILGWIILSEKLSWQTLAGSILVLIGVLFANLQRFKKSIITKSSFSNND
jgi:putative membrane protein PagO